MTRKFKRAILMVIDIVLIGAAFFGTYFFLDLYVSIPTVLFFVVYVTVLVTYLAVGSYLHIFSFLNRYINRKEIQSIVGALIVGQLAGLVMKLMIYDAINIRVKLLSFLLCILLVPLSRLTWSFWMEYRDNKGKIPDKVKKTLVLGAGEGGNILFNRLELEREVYQVVGIVDDDLDKQNTYLHHVPVVGTLDRIPELVRELEVEHLIIAIPSLPPQKFEQLLDTCRQLNLTLNRMPPLSEIFADDFTTAKLRDVDITDLLGRKEVELDMDGLSHVLKGKSILVTGAGGSIGSEICRQVIRFQPKQLVLLGHGENSIYQIQMELKSTVTNIIPVIADIQNRAQMFEVFQKFAPDVVYHAAAHKHVPLMEANPHEAVKNNIWGTKNVAEAAKAAKVGNFVMISTDKAVNPPNVMGATKRVAEMIVTGLNEAEGTKFCAVRFGNVLGSRGSVVPLFKNQIAKGGPVTVTDFKMTRYFMTIPEASRLVIQAGALADGGEIFILDMGEPVKIYDLAKKLIKLCGFNETQIPIVEAGIRPGEKLYEELLVSSEQTEKNIFEKIFVGKVNRLPWEEVMGFVESLEDNESLKGQLIEFANTAHVKKKTKVEQTVTRGIVYE